MSFEDLLNTPIINDPMVGGTVAAVTPISGAMPFYVTGVFEDDHFEADLSAGMTTHSIRFSCKLSEYRDAAQDDVLTINEIDYLALAPEPDRATDWVVIPLHVKR